MFRIIKFEQHRHAFLKDKSFKFWNTDETDSINYYSIIIGPNGTGKSFALAGVLEVLNELVLSKKDKQYNFKKKFTLEYQLEANKYFISNKSNILETKINDKDDSFLKFDFPEKWLASAVTINDKFPFLNYINEKKIPNYKYLGIRSASNNAFTGKTTSNTVINLIEAIKKGKTANLLSVFENLSLNTYIELNFSPGKMLKIEKREGRYSVYKRATNILEPHRKFVNKTKNASNFRFDTFSRYIDDHALETSIHHLLLDKKELFEKSTKTSIKVTYQFDLKDPNSYEKLINEWDILSKMIDLELLKNTDFVISKDKAFRYEEASSGENHLLYSLISIISNLENNSLLVTDEPEISLHPNWQIEYFDILKSIVGEFKGVHVLIATHSNLLVSSLKNEESRIISLKRNKKMEIETEEFDYETYGWDPESILYNVFEVATIRNKYFELDLTNLISLISQKSDKKEKIKELRDKVSKFVMEIQDDPLKLIINQVDKYLAE